MPPSLSFRRPAWRALAACTLAGVLVSTALAAPVTLDLPAQPLAESLKQLGRRAGLTLMVDAALLAGKTAPALRGQFEPGEALRRLLAGTGLSGQASGGALVIRPAPAAPQADAGAPAVHLAEVMVTADREPAFANSATVNTLGREQLDRFTATNAGDVFRDIPGVTAANNRSGASLDLNVRGLQGMGRVKILVDGTQSSSSDYRGYAGNHSHVYVDPELLSSVTVEKGPNAGPYGTGATAGVVSLQTLTADDLIQPGQSHGVRLRGSWGNHASTGNQGGTDGAGNRIPRHNTAASAAGAWQVNEHLDLVLALSQRQSGNYSAGRRGGERNDASSSGNGQGGYYTISPYAPGAEANNTSQDSLSGLVKASLRLPQRQKLDLGFTSYDNTFGSPRTTVGEFYTNQLRLSHTRKQTYSARYAWTPADNPLVDLRANVWMAKAGEFRANDYQQAGWDQTQDAASRSHGAEVWNTSVFALPWLGDLSLKYGATWVREKTTVTEHSGGSTQDPSGERDMHSLFAQFEARPRDGLLLHGGLRREGYRLKGSTTYPSTVLGQADTLAQFDDGDTRLNPSLGVEIEPWGPQARFFARYSEGWRPSTVKETINSYDPAQRPDLLRPEFSQNLEIGTELTASGLLDSADHGSLKLALFNTRYENFITGGLGSFWNIDGARYRGLELNLGYDTGWLFARYGLTRYLKVEMCDTNTYAWATRPAGVPGGCSGTEYTGGNLLEIGGINPPPRFQNNLTLGARLLERRLVLGLRITDVGERSMPKVYPDGRRGYDAGWTPYTVYDLFGSYQVSPQFAVNFSVENLRNTFYLDANTTPLSAVPAPGRTARVSVTYQF